MARELLFSLTRKDFVLQTFRSGGKGGQNQNKVETGVRIIHPASGAVGECREERSQLQNRRKAFRRLAESQRFRAWHRIMCARVRSGHDDVEARVDRMMQPKHLKIETGPF